MKFLALLSMLFAVPAFAGYEFASVGYEDVRCAFETTTVKNKCYMVEGEKKTGEFNQCFSPLEAKCKENQDSKAVSKCMKTELKKCCHKVGGKVRK